VSAVLKVRSITGVSAIDSQTWDALNDQAGGSYLTSHRFLDAFERSGSVAPGTGWQPQHLVLQTEQENDPEVVAVIPLYLKGHSYGEFVFDWAWADAYERNGLKYYPKWLSGVPFTPVSGARLLTHTDHEVLAAQALMQWAQAHQFSSLHVLYTTETQQAALTEAGCLSRWHTQFHWKNQDWASFDAFLQSLSQPKRKKIRAERRKVLDAGIHTTIKTGGQIEPQDWDFFYACYAQTYAIRGNSPYLTRAFFDLIAPEHCVLALAMRGADRIAASLLLLDHAIDPLTGQKTTKLYGRYWGALEHVDCLHFELAYYTPMAWAIEQGISVIEGGAQGEHKLARGFTPVRTLSAHWLAHPGFFNAVQDYVEREQAGVQAHAQSLRSPFRNDPHD
jgi:uncharacterized protein